MYIKYQLISISVITLIIASIISCSSKDKTVQKLDKENGFQGLILGDSGYNDFIKEVKMKASDDEIIEHHIFGNVIVPSKKIENENHRFVYGVLMNDLYGSSLNGKVYRYSLINYDPDSLSQRRLLDSLKTHYGVPSLVKDTTYEILETLPVKSHYKIWEGRHIKMIYEKRREGNNNFTHLSYHLSIIDKAALKQLADINNRVDSLIKQASKKLLSLENIGNLNLYSTKQELINGNILNVEKGDLKLKDGSNSKVYKIEFDTHLKPFFYSKNKRFFDIGNKSIADTFLNFSSKTDSLMLLNIAFNSESIDYSNLLKLFRQKFGENYFEQKLKSKNETYKRSYWLSKGANIELTNRDDYISHSHYYDEINVQFYIRKMPISLYFIQPNNAF